MPPIPVDWRLSGRDITEPRLSPDGRTVGYVVSEAGRSVIVVVPVGGGELREVTAEPQPRPGRGLGGGCWDWTPDGEAVVYAAADGALWRQRVDGRSLRRITEPSAAGAPQAPAVAPDGSCVAYVVDAASVWTVDLADRSLARLDRGEYDFCADPAWAPDSGSVSWQSWSVPDMPWDASVVVTWRRDELRSTWAPWAQAQQPGHLPDGTPVAVTDRSGWLNVEIIDGSPHSLLTEPFEHAGPSWGPGQRSYAVSPDGRFVAHTRNERGFGRLVVADLATGGRRELAKGVHGQLSWRGDHLVALRTGARTPTQVVAYEVPSPGAFGDAPLARTTLDVGPRSEWSSADAAAELVEPELVEVTATDGTTLHARLYRASGDEARLLCWLHGGPTDQWQVTFMPRLAYWRSRGWNILVPDHRGSTGHGRDYQQALRGGWGVVDVGDTVDAIRHAHTAGWGRPDRTALVGGSAGGFTALGVVAREPQLVAAAVVLYPVTDLLDLVARSHRFERHATHHLVGPLPGCESAYLERSPVEHAGRLRTPLLVLHGDADPVVPLEQSERLVERARAAGADVTLHVYAGEGHGFRAAANQRDEYERIEAFLHRVIGGGGGSGHG